MSKPLNWNESNPDAALLERVNPVFQTARMTLFQLAEIGDADAAALADIDGPVCVMTEGLLMYFTDSEVGTPCDNIRRILEKKGGCWYTSDPEAACQYAFIMKALVEDRYMEFVRNAVRLTGRHGGRGSRSPILFPD